MEHPYIPANIPDNIHVFSPPSEAMPGAADRTCPTDSGFCKFNSKNESLGHMRKLKSDARVVISAIEHMMHNVTKIPSTSS